MTNLFDYITERESNSSIMADGKKIKHNPSHVRKVDQQGIYKGLAEKYLEFIGGADKLARTMKGAVAV